MIYQLLFLGVVTLVGELTILFFLYVFLCYFVDSFGHPFLSTKGAKEHQNFFFVPLHTLRRSVKQSPLLQLGFVQLVYYCRTAANVGVFADEMSNLSSFAFAFALFAPASALSFRFGRVAFFGCRFTGQI